MIQILQSSYAVQIRVAVTLEQRAAQHCDGALAVATRFAEWLHCMWGVEAEVLYDKAPSFFKPVTAQEARSRFCDFARRALAHP